MFKRLFFVMLITCCVTSGYAQKIAPRANGVKLAKKEMIVKNHKAFNATKQMTAKELVEGVKGISSPKTAYADGFYYTRPEGSMYTTWGKEGSGYGPIFVVAPPFKEDIKATPVFTEGADTLAFEMRGSQTYDVTTDVYDKANKIITMPSLDPGYLYAMLTMIQGNNEFLLGETNSYIKQNPQYYTRYSSNMDFYPGALSFSDDHSDAGTYILGWGVLDKHYLFGMDTYTREDATTGEKTVYRSVGFEAEFPAPASPLFVEDVFIPAISFSQNPIPEGSSVKMLLYEPSGDKDNPIKKIYATLTATGEDLSEPEEYDNTYGKAWLYNSLTFANWEEDEFGSLSKVPFVIDGPLVVEVYCNDPKVDLGFYGSMNPEEDLLPQAKVSLELNDKTYSLTYQSPLTVPLKFTSFFDAAQIYGVIDDEGYIFLGDAEVVVGKDGKVADDIFVRTAVAWYGCDYDDDGNLIVNTADDGEEQYQFEGLPEWVSSVDVTTEFWGTEGLYAFNVINFTCEPLPADVPGRLAEVYVTGKGVKSAEKIILMQGDVTGIDAIKFDKQYGSKKAYNLAGQRVSKDYKGVILLDGKKYLAK